MILQSSIAEIIDRCFEIGPVASMEQEEVQAGNSILPLGSRPWLMARDWRAAVLSKTEKGPFVRVILVDAINPGDGAFSRLIDGICEEDLSPIVIEPIGAKILLILKHWGWERRRYSDGIHSEEQWYPPIGWKQSRMTTPQHRRMG